MKIVHQFENYYYDIDKNELFLSMSKRRIFPNQNGNFILKKNGKPIELTQKKLIELSSYRCVKINNSTPKEKNSKEKKKRHVIEALKNNEGIREIKRKYGVCYDTIYKIREEMKP